MSSSSIQSALRVRLECSEPLSAAARDVRGAGLAPGAGWEIGLGEWFRLIQRVSREGSDETCRMSARPLALGTTDFLVDTMRGAATLEEAMRRVARVYNLMHGGAYNRVERRPGRLVYVIDDRTFPYAADMPPAAAHTLIEGMQIFLHAMLSLAVGAQLDEQVARVTTRRARPNAGGGALAFWRAPVRCGAPVYTLEYADSVAQAPILSEGVITGDDVYDAAVALVAARTPAAASAFLDRCLDTLASGARDQPTVARSLGVSIATLRRRLDAEGMTFRELKAQAQAESARLLLAGGGAPADVAERLGFSDVRSFRRAFKARLGMTPTAFVSGRGERKCPA